LEAGGGLQEMGWAEARFLAVAQGKAFPTKNIHYFLWVIPFIFPNLKIFPNKDDTTLNK
jgi:hypothetical protein